MAAYFGCALGTLALTLLFRAPKRALALGVLLGLIAFGVYQGVVRTGGPARLGVFLGAFSSALLGELLARRMRMAAIVFITPSLLPLVPGLGLYRTMLLVVQNEMTAAAALGAETAVVLGNLALAVAAATLAARLAGSNLRLKSIQ